MGAQVLLGGQQFAALGALFDGTNDLMLRGGTLTGITDSKTGILSFWLRIDGGDGTNRNLINSTSARFAASITSSNTLQISGKNAGDTTRLLLNSNTAHLAGATWYHFLASWDLANSGAEKLYVNDSSDLAVSPSIFNDDLDYTVANYSIGSAINTAQKMFGSVAELYFAPGQFLDLSVEANRRKFISANGKPVNLGTDGSRPTGTAPIIYQRVGLGEAPAAFATNRGTGGDFSITSTLTAPSTSPSA